MDKEKLNEKLEDYERATTRLQEATKIKVENDIVYDGVIQRFEFTFELSWKLMKMYLEYTGITDVKNPRAIIREAFSQGLIDDGEEWIAMMIDRNKTSHLYDEEEAKAIYIKIKEEYIYNLTHLADKMRAEIDAI